MDTMDTSTSGDEYIWKCNVTKCQDKVAYSDRKTDKKNIKLYCKTHGDPEKYENCSRFYKDRVCTYYYDEERKVRCLVYAGFADEKSKHLKRCKEHSGDNFVDVSTNKDKQCIVDKCGKRAGFAAKEGDKAIICSDHRKGIYANYVDVNHEKCAFPKCGIQAHYIKIGDDKNKYCVTHAGLGGINPYAKECGIDDCKATPRYALAGNSPKTCFMHKGTDYIDVTRKRCECGKYAYYSLKGTPPETCSEHKLPNYVESNKRPLCDVCGIRASFALPHQKPDRCSTHKGTGRTKVNVIECSNPNCEDVAYYALLGQKPDTCSVHVKTGYVNVVTKKCKNGCNIIPTFGKIGSKTADLCYECAQKEVDYVDVKHKMCIKCGEKRMTHGKPGGKKELCYDCAEDVGGYINLSLKTCNVIIGENGSKNKNKNKGDECGSTVHYGFPGFSASCCAEHVEKGMVRDPKKKPTADIKQCAYCAIAIIPNQDYCEGCKYYTQNGETRKFKQKEEAVKNLLDKNKVLYTHDLTVKDGCSKKRPDFVINVPSGTIILEVDEHQHKRRTYSCECEITRMKQLYFDVGVKNLLFIRFNPDSYEVSKGKGKNASLADRYEYLTKLIKEYDREQLPEGLNVTYLYYDQFVGHQIENIDAYEN